jgi:hypothetical protein
MIDTSGGEEAGEQPNDYDGILECKQRSHTSSLQMLKHPFLNSRRFSSTHLSPPN